MVVEGCERVAVYVPYFIPRSFGYNAYGSTKVHVLSYLFSYFRTFEGSLQYTYTYAYTCSLVRKYFRTFESTFVLSYKVSCYFRAKVYFRKYVVLSYLRRYVCCMRASSKLRLSYSRATVYNVVHAQ